jgi:hypothetical protein
VKTPGNVLHKSPEGFDLFIFFDLLPIDFTFVNVNTSTTSYIRIQIMAYGSNPAGLKIFYNLLTV